MIVQSKTQTVTSPTAAAATAWTSLRFPQRTIQANVQIIAAVVRGTDKMKIQAIAGQIWYWDKVQQSLRRWIDLWNCVIGKFCVRSGIENFRDSRKITVSLSERGHGRKFVKRTFSTHSVVVSKEKSLT